jgi:[ribosomal protein S5]-alanine N-acetyltransferase
MEYAAYLETKCLDLRALAATDTAFITELIADERVRQFLGGPVPVERREAVANGYICVAPDKATWLVETKDSSQPIGLVFISKHKDGADFELSYMFSPNVWGMGYATEAVRRLLDHAICEMGIVRVIAETQAANQASRALLERLGMSEERRIHRFGAEQIIYTS